MKMPAANVLWSFLSVSDCTLYFTLVLKDKYDVRLHFPFMNIYIAN